MVQFPGIGPKMWKGGTLADYELVTGRGNSLLTWHKPSNSYLPNVVAQTQSSIGNLIPGLQIANLGVGVLTLGVSAYTAYKVHKMDKKIDALQATAARTEGKIDDLSSLLNGSVAHLDHLVTQNARSLHLVLEGQQNTHERIDVLRFELAEGVQSVHHRIEASEMRREALEMATLMRDAHGYYERCSFQLVNGTEPNHRDLELLIERARTLESWLGARIDAAPLGSLSRYPLLKARAFAIYLEMEARELLGESAQYRLQYFSQLRQTVKQEIEAVLNTWTVNELVTQGRSLIELYVKLARTLDEHSVTLVETADGHLLPMVSESFDEWDDSLATVASHLLEDRSNATPDIIELKMLKEFRHWEELTSARPGSSGERVPTRELIHRMRLENTRNYSDNGLRNLLIEFPSAEKQLRVKIASEF